MCCMCVDFVGRKQTSENATDSDSRAEGLASTPKHAEATGQAISFIASPTGLSAVTARDYDTVL